ncbi:MAG TPA: glycosyltransferase family 39 protein, partial [Streptosporangiaceae bacterium]
MTSPQYPSSPDDAWTPGGPAVPRVETLPAPSGRDDPLPGAITTGPGRGGPGRSRPGRSRPGRSQPGHVRPGRLPRLLRGPAADPRWARPALLALLALTALLYAAGLSRNGWANDFYSAAVQAGTRSWKAFFFGSFDASSFITVDKTPASLWVMELSARVFGLNYWSVLLPQAAEGVASAAVLYAAVRRWSGPAAGLIAAAVLATTPVATLMFRFNNPDALLVLLMTAAAYAMVRATESGRTRWIMLAGALLGFGFLTKMLQAFLVLPAFALVYLVAGPPRLGRRIWQLLAGGAALVVAAGWWVAAVQFTPAGDRPYVGGSTNDSILQLALGYNGLGRLDGNETGSVGFNGGGGAGGGGGGGSPFGGSTGLGRLFASEMGGQISWLLPAALIAFAALAWLSWRRGRTDRVRAAALLWGGWLVVTGLVFSYMSGIIHPYYTVALAPAIGALAGIGAVTAWRARRSMAAGRALAARILLAAALALTAWWAYVLLGRSAGWLPWLRPLILACGLAAAAVVIAGRWLPGRAVLWSVAPLALVASLAGPLAYSLNTAATPHTGALPSAGSSVASSGGPGGGPGAPGAGFGGPRAGGGPGGTTPGGPAAGGPAAAGSPSGGSAQGGAGTGTGAAGSSGVRGNTPGAPGGQGGGIGGGLGGSTQISSAITKLLT